jgi:hypothetical protein
MSTSCPPRASRETHGFAEQDTAQTSHAGESCTEIITLGLKMKVNFLGKFHTYKTHINCK